LEVRAQYIAIFVNGSTGAFFKSYGSVAFQNMMTWKVSLGSGKP